MLNIQMLFHFFFQELIEQMGRVEAQIFELKGQRDAAVALLPANTQNVGRLLGKVS